MERNQILNLAVSLSPETSKGSTGLDPSDDRLKIARRILRLLAKIMPKEIPDDVVAMVTRKLAEGLPPEVLRAAGISFIDLNKVIDVAPARELAP